MKFLKLFVTVSLAALTCSFVATAQNKLDRPGKKQVVIGNATLAREGTELVGDYEIQLGRNVKSCEVEVIIDVEGKKHIPAPPELKGDFGKITESGRKQVRYDFSKVKRLWVEKNLDMSFEVKNKNVVDDKVLIMPVLGLQIGYYENNLPLTCGLMLGYVKRFGGYVKLRSNFDYLKYTYECNRNLEVEGLGYVWGWYGNTHRQQAYATAGILFRLTKWLYPFAGAGYGTSELLIDAGYMQDRQWIKVRDLSCAGYTAEAGVVFRAGPISFSLGVSSIAFSYTDMELGLGVMF